MAVFALSDLHLGTAVNKPMDIFDTVWKNHMYKIAENWNSVVNAEDTVLVPGDISWGLKTDEVISDLDFIASLKGRKIIGKGNHDLWWKKINSFSDRYEGIEFLKSGFLKAEGFAVCGTKGYVCPGSEDFKNETEDMKLYLREVMRLETSIKSAINEGYTGEKIIVMLHYPPTNEKKENSLFTDIIKYYNIKTVIYGHLHSNRGYDASLRGRADNTEYYLVSSDYLKHKPLRLF